MGCSATHCITFLRCNSFSIGGNLSHCTTSVLIFTVIPDILKFSTHIEHIICNWRLISAFRPSTIALSVVSLLLEGSRRNWVHSSHHLLKSLNVCAFPMVNFFFRSISLNWFVAVNTYLPFGIHLCFLGFPLMVFFLLKMKTIFPLYRWILRHLAARLALLLSPLILRLILHHLNHSPPHANINSHMCPMYSYKRQGRLLFLDCLVYIQRTGFALSSFIHI